MLELDFTQTLGTHCLQIRETLPASGITAVFGVSGAGKTSLIIAISGLTRPQQGRIVLNGRVLNDVDKGICLAPEKRRIGYVFQDARLFPHYKVRGNLQYGMAKSMAAQFDKLVALLGIAPLLDRLPGGLSGGEKQRVAIGRALLTAPEVRTSSPVRILRGERRQSAVAGLYPLGEGAGYAGGIMSAAVDGLKAALEA